MSIIVWVVSETTGEPELGTEQNTGSPAEAIFLADAYQERFLNRGIVRIHAETDVCAEDLASLHEMARTRGFHLKSTFP